MVNTRLLTTKTYGNIRTQQVGEKWPVLPCSGPGKPYRNPYQSRLAQQHLLLNHLYARSPGNSSRTLSTRYGSRNGVARMRLLFSVYRTSRGEPERCNSRMPGRTARTNAATSGPVMQGGGRDASADSGSSCGVCPGGV